VQLPQQALQVHRLLALRLLVLPQPALLLLALQVRHPLAPSLPVLLPLAFLLLVPLRQAPLQHLL
jgi:hypothetical protein